jgi:hypothetical protein
MSAKWLREQFHEVLVDAGIETQAEADAAAKADDGTILDDLRRSAGTHGRSWASNVKSSKRCWITRTPR